jgi:hypothetical protein
MFFNAAMVRRGLMVLLTAVALSFLRPAHAHDASGYWAKMASEGKAPTGDWWKSLGSPGHGLCCDVADGFKVGDVDWDTARDAKAGPDGEVHYRVRLRGKWIVVPTDALVQGENRFGPAVVWPTCSFAGATNAITPCGQIDKATGKMIWNEGVEVSGIRCFLPGAGA